ncbi:MAG: hypothetical protein ABF335_03170 [Alphaproteobacteria bacterium]
MSDPKPKAPYLNKGKRNHGGSFTRTDKKPVAAAKPAGQKSAQKKEG